MLIWVPSGWVADGPARRASDNSNIRSVGLGVSIDLPIFDRNQGAIATETATRQKLFDEYTARVFEARSDIVTAAAELRAINDGGGEAYPTLSQEDMARKRKLLGRRE